MITQAGGYYDPNQGKFFLVMVPNSDLILDTISSHELMHALQDQHFGLNRYYYGHDGEGPSKFNDDEVSARRFIVEGEATLADVVLVLTRHVYCFVRVLDDIAGVISRGEMQKPVVRMWLFGFITTIEMALRERISLRWLDGGWEKLMTPSRLQKAVALRDERVRRGQECELLDCVQLSDVAKIVLAVPEERAAYGFDTAGAAKRTIKEMESLRNNLAHAQDIVTHDWAQIARMARNMEILAKEGEGWS